MAVEIPDTHIDLLEGKVYVTLVTMMADGQPQATQVWASIEDGIVYVNTAVGRQKDKNMQANHKVTLMAVDPENAYRWLEVRGKVISRTTEEDGPEALAHVNALANTYEGVDEYFGGFAPASLRDVQKRVKIGIEPVKVTSFLKPG